MQYNIFWRKKIRNRPLPLDWPGCHQHFLKKLWCNFWGVRGVARHNRPWAGGFGPLQTKQSDVTLGVQRDPESVRGRLGRAGPAAKEGGKRRSFCAPFHCAALPLQREITELLEFPRSGFSFGVRGAKVVAQQAWMSTLWISPSQFKKL